MEILNSLGILDRNGALTMEIGRIVSEIPLDPRLSVAIINSGLLHFLIF